MSFPIEPTSGIAVLEADGTVRVESKLAAADVCFTLTAQDGGAVPTGSMYVFKREPDVSFTIASTMGAVDAGVVVYWCICR